MTHDAKLLIRLPASLKRDVDEAARLAGQTTSAWVRSVLLREAGEELAGWSPLEVASLDEEGRGE